MKQPAQGIPPRVPPAAIIAAVVAALAASVWAFKLQDFIPAALQGGLGDILPPVWQLRPAALRAHLLVIAEVLWLSWLFAVSGDALCSRMGARSGDPLGRWSLGFAVGTGLWANAFFVLSLLHLLYRPLLLALLGVGSLLGAWESSRAKESIEPAPSEPDLWSWPVLGTAILLALFLFANLPYILVPELYYDSLEYHLALPNLYLLKHAMVPLPDNAFAGVPGLAGLMYGWTLLLDPDGLAAHLLGYSFLAWNAAALVSFGRQLRSAAAGVMAAAMFALIPVVLVYARMTTIELVWSLYLTLAFSSILAASQTPADARERRAWLILCGALLGFAMASKYLAWLLPVALLAAGLGLRREAKGGTPALGTRDLLLACAVAGAVLLPWVLRNLAFYRNPLYPFFHEYLFPKADLIPGWRYVGSDARYEFGQLGLLGYAKAWLTAPFRMVYYKRWADSLGPLLHACAPMLLFVSWTPPMCLLAWLILGSWLPLSFLADYPRYFIPSLGPLCLLLTLALFRVEKDSLRRGLAAGLFICLCVMALWFLKFVVSRDSFAVFTGDMSRAEFLSRPRHHYPAPLYPAAEFIDKNAPPEARVLVFGDARGFHLRRDHVLSTPWQASVLERWANRCSSGKELRELMAAQGITHILVNHAELRRLLTAMRFSVKGKRSLDEFWERYALKVFEDGPYFGDEEGRKTFAQWTIVYRLLAEEDAAAPHPHDDLFAAYTTRIPKGAPTSTP